MEEITDLGFETPWGTIEPFEEIGWGLCLHCERELNEDNNSGWDVFVGNGTKCQRVCKKCDVEKGPKKGDVIVDHDGNIVGTF